MEKLLGSSSSSSSIISGSSSSQIRGPPKLLSDKDYPNWSILMRNYLIEQKLEGLLLLKFPHWKNYVKYVDGQQTDLDKVFYQAIGVESVTTIVQPKVKIELNEEKRDDGITGVSDELLKQLPDLVYRVRKLYSFIYDAITPELRMTIDMDCQHNGVQLWNSLRERLMGTSTDIQYANLRTLMALKQSDGELFTDYKIRVDNLNYQLSHTGEDLSPTFYRFILLKNLRPEYDTIMNVIESTIEYSNVESGKKSIELWTKISATITQFERTLNHSAGVHNSSSGTAMYTQVNRFKGRKPMDKSKLQCRYCKEFGHMKFDCEILKNKNKDRETSDESVNMSVVSSAPRTSTSNSSISILSPQFGMTLQAMIPKPLYKIGRASCRERVSSKV